MRGSIRACLAVVMSGVLSVAAYADATLRLTVQGPDGNALAEMPCNVHLRIAADAGSEREENRDLQTNAEGILDVPVAPLARYRGVLTVPGVGYAAFGPRFAHEDGQVEETTVKLTRTGRLRVRVTRKDNDETVANASVRAYEATGQQGLRSLSGRTDEEGYCLIEDIAPAKWHFSAYSQDFLRANAEVVVTGAQELQHVTMQLDPGATIGGVVLLEDAETPAVGAEVSLSNRRNAVRTDDHGRFSFDHRDAGEERISVWHEGFTKHETTVEVKEGQAPPPVRIILKNRGGSLSGVVENDDEGKPMPGEMVVAAAYQGEYPDYGIHELSLERLVTKRSGWYARDGFFGPWPCTVTDEDGRFGFERLPAGKYLVCVLPGNMPGARREGVIVEEGERTENVTVHATAKPKGFLLLRFVNGEGAPLKGRFHVQLRGAGYTHSTSVSTDETGAAYQSCRDRRGAVDLHITAEGYEPVEKAIQADPAACQEIVVVMREQAETMPEEQGRGALAGMVLMPDGKTPAVGALVVPYTKDTRFPEFDTKAGDRRLSERMSVITDAKGSFRIANLRPGEYGVFATPRTRLYQVAGLARPEFAECVGAISPLIAVAANDSTRIASIAFGKAAALRIHVLNAETGDPIPEATASFHETSRPPSERLPFEGMRPEPRSDENGIMEITGLIPGEYRISVRRDAYEPDSRSNVAVNEERTPLLEFKLNPYGYADVTGIVRLPDGAAANGAEIFSSARGEKPLATTNAEGRFTVEKQREGPRTWYVEHAGFALAKQEFDVVVGQENEIVFNLTVGGVLKARVLDGQGNVAEEDVRIVLAPVEQVVPTLRFLLRQPRKDVFVSILDENGQARLEHLPSCPMTLLVVKDWEILSAKPNIEVADGKTVELSLTSRKERGVIEGRVVRPNGVPVAEARIHVLGFVRQESVQGKIETDTEGTYRAECLPGRWAVAVGVEGEKEIVVRGQVDAKDGETLTLDFTMGPYGSVSGRITDANGRPATGMGVATLATLEQNLFRILPEVAGTISVVMTKIDEEGRFTLNNLLEGEYDLYVVSANEARTEQLAATVRVEAGKDTVADIVLNE